MLWILQQLVKVSAEYVNSSQRTHYEELFQFRTNIREELEILHFRIIWGEALGSNALNDVIIYFHFLRCCKALCNVCSCSDNGYYHEFVRYYSMISRMSWTLIAFSKKDLYLHLEVSKQIGNILSFTVTRGYEYYYENFLLSLRGLLNLQLLDKPQI